MECNLGGGAVLYLGYIDFHFILYLGRTGYTNSVFFNLNLNFEALL